MESAMWVHAGFIVTTVLTASHAAAGLRVPFSPRSTPRGPWSLLGKRSFGGSGCGQVRERSLTYGCFYKLRSFLVVVPRITKDLPVLFGSLFGPPDFWRLP